MNSPVLSTRFVGPILSVLSVVYALSVLPPFHPSVAAQSNAERVTNGYYTPSHDYDLVHQRIEVRNFDWDSTTFDGRVTTTLVSLRPALDSVILDMDRQLEVRTVSPECRRRERSCAPLAFARPGDSLVVRLPRSVSDGDTVRFTVSYRGRIKQGRGLYFFEEEPGRPHRPQQVYSGGGTDGNPRWLPTWGGPADKATWELIATVPSRFTVVSNGRMVSDRLAGGQRTTHWAQEKPASTYLISLAVAPFARVSDRWRGKPIDYYVYQEDRSKARRLFGFTPDLLETYSSLTGVPYPWNKYAQTTVADFIGGMENVSATTLVDWLPDSLAYLDRPWYQWALIPHETAHQWFGDLVTTENWANYWLNEGFAEFMPGQYWATKLGERAEEDYYLSEYRDYITADRRRRMPLAAWNSNVVYPKGALVLSMLKTQLGPRRFWASMQRYLKDHAYGNATSDDLRQAVLGATGESLGWFWSQWIYRAGFPAFSITSAYDSAAGSLTLTVRQTQTDTATADSTGLRFETPLAFRAPVVVRVGTAGGDTLVRANIDRREETIRIDRLRSAPTMVVFDADNAVVKSLDFPQPTAWLATQLEREHNLWNRSWAIDQLRGRRADTVAATALGRAARQADYPLVRAHAAAALGNFPPSVALGPLETAIRDSSATVRKSAASALGALADERVVKLLEDTWLRDRSYQTRAAALTALARRDPGRAREQIMRGLETPSYRDVIQNAAIAAALPRADSGLIAAIARRVGDQPAPAIALVLLGARGDSTALAAWASALDDDRGWVRGWAIEAAEDQLDRDDAVALLQAALPTVRKAAARAAIEDAVERLGRAKS